MPEQLCVLEHKDSFLDLHEKDEGLTEAETDVVLQDNNKKKNPEETIEQQQGGQDGQPNDDEHEGSTASQRKIVILEYEMPSDHYEDEINKKQHHAIKKSLLYYQAKTAQKQQQLRKQRKREHNHHDDNKNQHDNHNPWQEFVNNLPWNKKNKEQPPIVEEENEDDEEYEHDDDEDEEPNSEDKDKLWKNLLVPEMKQTNTGAEEPGRNSNNNVVEWQANHSLAADHTTTSSQTHSDLQSHASSVTGPIPHRQNNNALKGILKKPTTPLAAIMARSASTQSMPDDASVASGASGSTWNTNNTAGTNGSHRRAIFGNVPQYQVQSSTSSSSSVNSSSINKNNKTRSSKQRRSGRRGRRTKKRIKFHSTVRVRLASNHHDDDDDNMGGVKDVMLWWQPNEYTANDETTELVVRAVREEAQRKKQKEENQNSNALNNSSSNMKLSAWSSVWQLDQQQAGGGGLTSSMEFDDDYDDCDEALFGLEDPFDNGMQETKVSWTWALFYGHSARGLEHAVDPEQGAARTLKARESIQAVLTACQEEGNEGGEPKSDTEPIQDRIKQIYRGYSQPALELAQQRGQTDAAAVEADPDAELQQQYEIYNREQRVQRNILREKKASAATILQSWHRRQSVQQIYQGQKNSSVRLQSMVRMWLAKAHYQRQQRSAISIQAVTRRYLVIVYMTMDPVLYNYKRNISSQRIGAEDLYLMPVPEDEQEESPGAEAEEANTSEEVESKNDVPSKNEGVQSKDVEESTEDLRYWKVNITMEDSSSSMQQATEDKDESAEPAEMKKSLEEMVLPDGNEIPSLTIAPSSSWDTTASSPPSSPSRLVGSIAHEEKLDDRTVPSDGEGYESKNENDKSDNKTRDIPLLPQEAGEASSKAANVSCGRILLYLLLISSIAAVIAATAFDVSFANIVAHFENSTLLTMPVEESPDTTTESTKVEETPVDVVVELVDDANEKNASVAENDTATLEYEKVDSDVENSSASNATGELDAMVNKSSERDVDDNVDAIDEKTSLEGEGVGSTLNDTVARQVGDEVDSTFENTTASHVGDEVEVTFENATTANAGEEVDTSFQNKAAIQTEDVDDLPDADDNQDQSSQSLSDFEMTKGPSSSMDQDLDSFPPSVEEAEEQHDDPLPSPERTNTREDGRKRPLHCRGILKRFCKKQIEKETEIVEHADNLGEANEQPHDGIKALHHAYHTRRWRRIHAHSEHSRHTHEEEL